jgi:hypothetical protein
MPRTRPRRRLTAAFVLLAGVLAGCYLPTDFQADLQIDDRGNYAFRYIGNLTDLSMLQRMASGDLRGDAIAERAEVARRDLGRDKAFREIKYLEKGKFKVRYERRGNILIERSFDFVRFNSRFLGLKRLKGGTVVVFGGKPNDRDIKRLEEAGLKANGELRVWTNAKVIDHNAQDLRPVKGLRLYIWRIKSLKQAPPKLKLKIG